MGTRDLCFSTVTRNFGHFITKQGEKIQVKSLSEPLLPLHEELCVGGKNLSPKKIIELLTIS